MKLEMTLPERPGFLHVLPVVDVFLLLIFFFMLGPSLVLQSGVMVELPPSKFQMERFRDTMVVTLGAGQNAPAIHFGHHPVTFDELSAQLDRLRSNGMAAKAIILLQSAVDTPVGVERQISELILGKGFRLALVGRPPQQPQASGNPDTAPNRP